jgi:hypothetical protein
MPRLAFSLMQMFFEFPVTGSLLTLAFVLTTRKDDGPDLPERRQALSPVGPAAVDVASGTQFRPCLTPSYYPVLKVE